MSAIDETAAQALAEKLTPEQRAAFRHARFSGRAGGAVIALGLPCVAAAALVVTGVAGMGLFVPVAITAAALTLAGNAIGLSLDRDNWRNNPVAVLAHALLAKPDAAQSVESMRSRGFNTGLGHGIIAPVKGAAMIVLGPFLGLVIVLALASGGPREGIYREISKIFGLKYHGADAPAAQTAPVPAVTAAPALAAGTAGPDFDAAAAKAAPKAPRKNMPAAAPKR